MTEVMFFFFCHKGIISTIGIMHICLLGKEGFFFTISMLTSLCGMRKSFPLFSFLLLLLSFLSPYLYLSEKYLQLKSVLTKHL